MSSLSTSGNDNDDVSEHAVLRGAAFLSCLAATVFSPPPLPSAEDVYDFLLLSFSCLMADLVQIHG